MRNYVLSVAILFTFACIFPGLLLASTNDVKQTFSIGFISNKPQKRIQQATPLINYIVHRLPRYSQGKIYVNENINVMADMLKTGAVKMVMTTAYAGLMLEQKSNASIAALRWKQGVDSYYSVIFSRYAGEIQKVEDLVGQNIVFERDSSTSAFFMPSLYLLNQGYQLQRVRSLNEKPAADKIGYIFISDLMRKSNEINMSIGVYSQRMQAAAFSHLDWEDPETTPAKAKQGLQVIAKTESFPRGVVLLSPVIEEEHKQAILNVLLTAQQSEEGIKAMLKLKKTSRFSTLSVSSRALLEKALQQIVKHPELYY